METHKDTARGRIGKLTRNMTGNYLISLFPRAMTAFLVVFWRMLEALLHKHRTAHSSNASHVAGLELTFTKAELALSYLRLVRVIFSFRFPGVYIISQILFKKENAMSIGLLNAALEPQRVRSSQAAAKAARELTHFCS